jgi:O-acetyl-ADP-ribose deacetylase (regulator of RNase III)
MKLSVYTGSLVDPAIGAHAVVNASNPSVALGSGVSGALREACGGTAFQQELRDRLEEDFDAELEPDDCLVTSAGTSTAFRWVLHVPAVDYRKRDPETGGPSGPRRVVDREFKSLILRERPRAWALSGPGLDLTR